MLDWLAHGGLSDRRLAVLRLIVAGAAVSALVVEVALELRGDAPSSRAKKLVGGVLASLAVVVYFQAFDFGYTHLLHRSEHFHYHVGAKYLDELGYERLYVCSTVAEVELRGEAAVRGRTLRDLSRNELVPATTALERSDECHARFSSTRWASFRRDVGVFRDLAGDDYWQTIQNDHGFNGTPAWAVVGRSLASLAPASPGFLRGLAGIDLVLMSATMGMLAWAFGWRVMCLAAVFWGTQAASTLYWTGGAFLRQDGIACLVGAACFLRKGRPGVAGGLLAYATLTRLYPVFVVATLAVTALGAWYRRGELPREWKRLAMGALVVACVLGPASLTTGTATWREFATHLRMHDATPTSNRMGLRAVLGHHAEGRIDRVHRPRAVDPFARWKELRRARLADLRLVHVGGLVAGAGLIAWAAHRLQRPWLSLGVGLLALTVHAGLTCYYHSFLVLAAPLSRARRHVELALLAVAVVGNAITLRFVAWDDRYALLSLLHIAFAVFVAMLLARTPASFGLLSFTARPASPE